MNNISSKHHFVPRFFLRNFSRLNDKNKYIINAFNKNNFKEYSVSIEKIAYIKNFHTFEIDGVENDIIEKAHNIFFEKNTAIKLNTIISKLNNFINTFFAYNCINDIYLKDYLPNEHFNIEDKMFISFLLAYFILRGKKLNSFGNYIYEQMKPRIEEMYNAHNVFDKTRIEDNLIENFGTETQRRLSQQKSIFTGEQLNELSTYLYMHTWSIGVNLTSELLYSSDNVHAMDTLNRVESIYNNIGYCTYGNIVIFPISPRICIYMYDSDFLVQNNLLFEDLKINFLTTENVKYVNSLMLFDAVDELYSYDGNFNDLQEFCKKMNIEKGHKPYGMH